MFDFGIGGSEILVIAVVALVVIGPKDLPRVLRMIGRMMASVRGMAREFQVHLDAAMKDTGLDELKQEVQNLRSMADDQTNSIGSAIASQGQEMNRLLSDAPPTPVMPKIAQPAAEPAAPEAAVPVAPVEAAALPPALEPAAAEPVAEVAAQPAAAEADDKAKAS